MERSSEHIGKNIRRFRQRAGLTIKALALQVGIQPGPLGNLEHGKHAPSTGVLLQLAEVLGVSLDAFFLAPTDPATALPPIQRTDTLKLPAALARELHQLMEEVFVLEDACGVPKHANIPLAFHTRPEIDAMEDLANRFRSALGIGDSVLFDYVEVFEANAGFRVISLPLPDEIRAVGVHDSLHANAFFFLNRELSAERQLFGLAYELGLLILQQGLATPQAIEQAEITKLASRFAAVFLMPEQEILRTLRQLNIQPDAWTFPLLLRLKSRIGVSAESYLYRLDELGQIDPELKEQLKQQLYTAYDTTFVEPGESRRTISPNARIGDLLYIAGKAFAAQPLRAVLGETNSKYQETL